MEHPNENEQKQSTADIGFVLTHCVMEHKAHCIWNQMLERDSTLNRPTATFEAALEPSRSSSAQYLLICNYRRSWRVSGHHHHLWQTWRRPLKEKTEQKEQDKSALRIDRTKDN